MAAAATLELDGRIGSWRYLVGRVTQRMAASPHDDEDDGAMSSSSSEGDDVAMHVVSSAKATATATATPTPTIAARRRTRANVCAVTTPPSLSVSSLPGELPEVVSCYVSPQHTGKKRERNSEQHVGRANVRARVVARRCTSTATPATATASALSKTRESIVAALGIRIRTSQGHQPQASAAVLRTRRRLRPILKSHTRLAAAQQQQEARQHQTAAAAAAASAAAPGVSPTATAVAAAAAAAAPGVSPTTTAVAAAAAAAGVSPTTTAATAACVSPSSTVTDDGGCRVRFAATAKAWDGVRFDRKIFDTLVTSYFEGRMPQCRTTLALTAANNPSLLHKLVDMCQDLANRIVARDSAPVLPHGGGSAARLGREHLVPLLVLQGMIDAARGIAARPTPSCSGAGAGVGASWMTAPSTFDFDDDVADVTSLTFDDLSFDAFLDSPSL